MNCNLLYSAWRYKIHIGYRVDEKVFYEDFQVITHKNYSDIREQFPKFIMRDVKSFFHNYEVILISAQIVDLESLW